MICDWIIGFVPESIDHLWIFTIAGILGVLVGVVSPLFTLAAVAAVTARTVWRRDLSLSLVALWLSVCLAVWANFRIAAVLKRCCI
jgi:hypothetical protein